MWRILLEPKQCKGDFQQGEPEIAASDGPFQVVHSACSAAALAIPWPHMQQRISFSGSVPVGVAVALLASLRELDTPADPEALAESDLPLNLQRRLGLSTVVIDQIRRYEQRKNDVSATEVANLFKLISRRSDAGQIFEDAGEQIARNDLDGRRLIAKLGLRIMPQSIRCHLAWNRVRRIAQGISPGALIRVQRKAHTLVVKCGLSAAAAEGGTGCSIISGTIRQVFAAYQTGEVEVRHTTCEGLLGDHCEWSLILMGGQTTASLESTVEVEPTGNGPTPDGTTATKTVTTQPESVVSN